MSLLRDPRQLLYGAPKRSHLSLACRRPEMTDVTKSLYPQLIHRLLQMRTQSQYGK